MKNKKKLAVLASLMLFIMFLLASKTFAYSQENPNPKTSMALTKMQITKNIVGKEIKYNQITQINNETNNKTEKISIMLDQKKQTSTNKKAVYKIIIESDYSPQNTIAEPEKYTLKFDSKNDLLKGKFETNTISLLPGEKKTVELEINADSAGEYEFIVFAEDERGNKVESIGSLLVLEQETKPYTQAKIEISPEKQYAERGISEYKITLYLPLEKKCLGDYECENYSAQKYSLKFASEQNSLYGKFETNTISLLPGEKKTTYLQVRAEKEGTYIFKVYATTTNYEISAKGLLFYDEKQTISSPAIQTQISSTFLNSEGFAINSDKSEGVLTNVYLLDNEKEIRGKIIFNEKTYAIKGDYNPPKLEFDIFNTEENKFYNPLGKFAGDVKKFEEFTILEGTLNFWDKKFPNDKWALTLMNKQNRAFENKIVLAQSNTTITKKITKEEIVTIKQKNQPEVDKISEMKEVYIVPEKIERKKILGIIPNPWGEKYLKVKLVEEDKTTEKTVKEFSTAIVGDYKIGVGSLENEEAIEISIAKK